MSDSKSGSYKLAGVDVEAGYKSFDLIKNHLEKTRRAGSIGEAGGFGGLFEPDLRGMKRPVAVSGTDGVGTKLKIAFMMDKHDTIGIDCVAMCVNDIICAGAQPAFFLDYIAMGRNIPERTERIVAGVAEGCIQAGCALVGGEMAEHPGLMPDDEYDIAGFSVGFVDHDSMIDGKTIVPGDAIIGLASSGLHSNGYTLVRKILFAGDCDLEARVPDFGCTLGEELLRPTRIYVNAIMGLATKFRGKIKGICNITGGGFYENIPRMLPDGIRAGINAAGIPALPVFSMLAKMGAIPQRDMYATFNMGVGMAIAVAADAADAMIAELRSMGEKPIVLGTCEQGEKGVDLIW
ncbi:MAG: phosphoribosylformylglycinamidine cyclo-ligase [Oscillospiraceae bacterium]|nr:phosphoribosylformylglycinamidine cyclo-ligase [Oscillospiraceae bacterium]